MEGSSSNNSRRRRGLGIVTPNACTECRKRRAKCDGKTPCGRCTLTSVDCVYEMPVRQSKENMRSEIEQLRAHQKHSERVLAALASRERPEQIIDQLRNGESLENITERLGISGAKSAVSGGNITIFKNMSDHHAVGNALKGVRNTGSSPTPTSMFALNDMYNTEGSSWPSWNAPGNTFSGVPPTSQAEDMMMWDADSLQPSERALSFSSASSHPLTATAGSYLIPDNTAHYSRGQGQEKILGQSFGLEEAPDQPHPNVNQSWTEITSDGAFVEHLLALYFCWEYPTFAPLSKEHFLEDFRNGSTQYCSSLLVNAVLAVGCRFSNHPEARLDPNDSRTAGDDFFAEAERLLKAERTRSSLTRVQALGLMSIRQASCGRTSHSLFLSGQSIRLAIEMGLHLVTGVTNMDDEKEREIRSATFWGAFSLDQAWSLSIGRLPYFSRDTTFIPKPPVVEQIEASAWVPYTDDGAPLESACIQPSNVRSVYRTFCELAETVHRSMYTSYTPGTPITAKSLIEAYNDYLGWYESIPTTLRLGYNFTPAVLFAHMYYHYAILLLFRPFIKLGIINSSVSPRDLCVQAADAISALVNSYGNLYNLRRTPSFVPYFVMSAGITHLLDLGGLGPMEGVDDVGILHAGKEMEGVLGPTSRPEKVKKVRMAISQLKEMTAWHGFAGRAVDILRYLVDHWQVDINVDEDEVDAYKPGESDEKTSNDGDNDDNDNNSLNSSAGATKFKVDIMDKDIGADSRVGGSSKRLKIGRRMSSGGIRGSTVHDVKMLGMARTESSNVYCMNAPGMSFVIGLGRDAENPLFWPFPLQGRPLMASREELAEGGFKII